ncbi:IclR family transcriptional regulator [Halovulum sp. GXIMD14793]
MSDTTPSSGTVRKALNVLEHVTDFERPVRFNEILDASPYPRGTLYRMLQTLRTEGLLSYDDYHQTYSLGFRLVRLAHTAWAQFSLAPVARPFIDALSASIGETIHIAQLEAGQVLYVDKRNAERPIEMFSQAGKVGPAYCTGVGKAMLAFLPERDLNRALDQQAYHGFTPSTLTSRTALSDGLDEVRARGFALDREEHEPGIICVAVPILTSTRSVIGAISVTSTTSKTTLAELETFVPEMQDAASKIAATAEHWRFPADQTAAE